MSRPIWQIEIRVNDLQRAIKFFSGVFKWEITPMSDDYAMIDTGKPLASLWQIGDSGMPLGICHYVQSADCDADAGRAVGLGGAIAVQKTLVPGAGSWTDTLDPWKNELAFWQADSAQTSDLQGSPDHRFAWVEMGATDLQAAMAYYKKLVDWDFELVEGTPDYAICTRNQPGIGLVGGDRGARLRGLTPYVTTPHIAKTCEKITKLGGNVLEEPRDLGDGSLFTLFLDPDQNRFGLIERKV